MDLLQVPSEGHLGHALNVQLGSTFFVLSLLCRYAVACLCVTYVSVVMLVCIKLFSCCLYCAGLKGSGLI